MARRMKDATNVYRFKTTHVGVYVESGKGLTGKYWRGHEGETYCDVEFHGPYTTRIPWSGWIPTYGSYRVERQQLIAQYDDSIEESFLMWQTIETKSYEEGEQQ